MGFWLLLYSPRAALCDIPLEYEFIRSLILQQSLEGLSDYISNWSVQVMFWGWFSIRVSCRGLNVNLRALTLVMSES